MGRAQTASVGGALCSASIAFLFGSGHLENNPSEGVSSGVGSPFTRERK